ncbi:hypothetical protein HK104_000346 [Borealophlyctis nickersoniae]|nr:hypothetical protein HK104_000346 [Borealophlyctis nickersoniae]
MLTLTTIPEDVVLEIGKYLEDNHLLELSLTSKRCASMLSSTLLRAKWEEVQVYIGHRPAKNWAPLSDCVQWTEPLPDVKAHSHLVREFHIVSDADVQTIVAALPEVARTACLCSGVVLLYIRFPGIVYREFGEVAGLFLEIVRSMPELRQLTFDGDPDFDFDDFDDDVNLCQPMTAGPMNSIVEIAPCTLQTIHFEGFEPIRGAQVARFRNLKTLELPSTQRIDAALLDILQTHCPCLGSLEVSAPPLERVLVAGTFTVGLLNLLPRLRELRLSQRHLPPSDVEAIISRALTSANFEALRLEDCLFETTYDGNTMPNTVFAIQHILRRPLSPQLSSTPISLTELGLSSVPLSLDMYNTRSSGHLPKLKSLEIASSDYQSCGALRDHHLEGFLYHAPHLTKLWVQVYPTESPSEDPEVPLITIATLASIARYGRALEDCCIQDETIEDTATFDHVVAIVQMSPELESLCLGSSERPEMRIGRNLDDNYDPEWMRKALTEVRAAGLEGGEMLAEMERKWAVEGESDSEDESESEWASDCRGV